MARQCSQSQVTDHPIAGLFPEIDAVEYRALKEDIREQGLREPIWLYQGKIIDGRHRFRACLELRIFPRFRKLRGQLSEADLIRFVYSANHHRRHLTASQRAVIAAEVQERLFRDQGKRRRVANLKHGDAQPDQANLPDRKGDTREIVANNHGISARLLQDALTVYRSGAPELYSAVKDGKLKVSVAVKVVRAGFSKPLQTRLVSLGARGIHETIRRLKIDNVHNVVAALGGDMPPDLAPIAPRNVGQKSFFTADQEAEMYEQAGLPETGALRLRMVAEKHGILAAVVKYHIAQGEHILRNWARLDSGARFSLSRAWETWLERITNSHVLPAKYRKNLKLRLLSVH
jgi:hypothetical protein